MPTLTCRGQGDPLVLIHGFTQTQRSWDGLADRLAKRYRVITVDAPGHGDSSEWVCELEEGAAGIGRAAGPGTYIGYSMGGRFALNLAVARPDLVGRLVLISTTAGIEDPGERAARQRHDEGLAERVEAEGVEAFVSWWLSQPMWATLPPDAAGGADRLRNTAEGLASSLRLAGAGHQAPLWGRLGELTMPVLVVAGGLDAKYRVLAQRLGRAIPGAEVALVAGGGHACHLEQPDAVGGLLERWLAEHPGPRHAH